MSDEFLVTTFTELRKGFLRLASRFLPNEEDASDALQDAFCRLWPKRNQIHSSKEAEALAVTTIRNLCIDQIRKDKVDVVELDAERDAKPSETIEERIAQEELYREVEEIIHRQKKLIRLLCISSVVLLLAWALTAAMVVTMLIEKDASLPPIGQNFGVSDTLKTGG